MAGLLAVGLCLCAAGCPSDEDSSATASDGDQQAAELDRLRALPYLDFSESPIDGDQEGVVVWDPDRSYPGYTLYKNHL